MRVRPLLVLGALLALAIAPAPALAAPKKAQIRFTATTFSVVESAGTFNLVVQRAGNTSVTASANIAIDPASTATGGGVDYTYSGPSTVTFNPGQVQQTIPVTIVDNTTTEAANKRIVFRLSGASPSGTQLKNNPATVTIIDNEGPGTLDFSSSAYSVVESAGVATVTVNRSGATNLALSVDYATAGSTATPAADYTPISPAKTLAFAPGEITKSFQVQLTDDSAAESAESVNLVLSNPKNLSGGAAPQLGPNSPAVLTINDDDVSTFSFASSLYSVNENDPAGATITVKRSGATNIAASVDYATSNDTASGSDYTPTSGTLNFAAGETSKAFSVAVTNDGTSEANETVNLTLSHAGTAVATSLLSIIDNDNPKGSVQLSDVSYEVNESDSTVAVTVTLSHPVDADVTVHYATADGSAAAGSDYTATSGTLTFAGNLTNGGVGETQKTFTVPLTDDDSAEDDETFDVTLSSVAPALSATAGAPGTATITIADNDPPGELDFAAVRYDVNETAGQASVTVRRLGGTNGTVTVDYATGDGSATAGYDYTPTSGTLTFGHGEVSKTINVPIAHDGRGETTETINVMLSNPGGGSDVGPNNAAVIGIADDGESGPFALNASSYDVGEAEALVTIMVSRSGGSLGGPVTVDYATSDGSATAGVDYTAASGSLTFGPGETSKSFTVAVVNDSSHEDSEAFHVVLSNAGGGAALGTPAAASVAITDDDAAPTGAAPGADTAPPAQKPLETTPGNPGPDGSQTTAPDKQAPKVTLSAKKIQKAFKAKLLVLVASCDENCKLAVVAKVGKGRKALALGKASISSARGFKAKLKIRLSKKSLAKLAKVLNGGKAKITVTVVARDAAGNVGKAARAISVRR
jgi:hypothetical protein